MKIIFNRDTKIARGEGKGLQLQPEKPRRFSLDFPRTLAKTAHKMPKDRGTLAERSLERNTVSSLLCELLLACSNSRGV